jgi:hypothetical protein
MNSSVNVPPIIGSSATDSSSQRAKRNPILNKFLSKMYHLLDNCDTEIASWSRGGEAFTIWDQERLQAEVLPKYFNHSKIASFIRQ